MKKKDKKLLRKTLFINKPFQFMIIGYFTFLALCATLPLFWLSISRHTNIVNIAAQTGALQNESFKNFLESQQQIIYFESLIILISSVGLFYFISLYLSHRIAGPIHRLKLVLKESGETKTLKKFNLRKKDHLKDLEKAWNKFVDDYSNK